MIHSSPIPALIDYYRRLVQDSNATVESFGFSRQKISFRVVIEADGRLFEIQNARDNSGKKPTPIAVIVPGQTKPSGSGINPGFLWDNAQYMLGVKLDDPDPKRTESAFQAFRKRHLDLADTIEDPAFRAVCRFLEQWQPEHARDAEGFSVLEELGSGFGVFQVRGQPEFVHDRPAVTGYWQQHLANQTDSTDDKQITGQSLVSGRTAPLARLHEPKIKNVIGGQSSGGVLVGFNEDAYTSFGKSQSYNAPIGVDEAFEYCTALNRLLGDNAHRARLGDATVVFWSERRTDIESAIAFYLGCDVEMSQDAEDASTTQRVKTFLDALRRGSPHEGLGDAEVPFYILGLSPNAARISVRFWLASTVGEFAQCLKQHVQDTRIIASDDEPLTIRRLLFETAREPKDIPPQLAGEVARAILTGGRYPLALYTAVLRRLRADQTMNHRRAAILKACLIRNFQMEVPVALNVEHPDAAYHMGRLFAVLEKTQQDASPGLNKTIKDSYFASAASTPGSVFPRLIRLHQHHIEKLEGGFKVNREKLIQEICSHIDRFPAHLTLEQQGLFHIAYYHQRQDFFTKRNGDPLDSSTISSEETVNA